MKNPKKVAAGSAILAACAVIVPLALSTSASAATEAPTKTVQVAFGDSLTTAAAVGGRSASGKVINDINGSWSTGADPRSGSHRLKIEALSGKAVEAHNLAKGGSRSGDLLRQAAGTPSNATYATVLTGGNDICAADSVATLPAAETIKNRVATGVAEIKRKAPQAKILIGSIPNLIKLYSVVKESPTGTMYHESNLICPIALGTSPSESSAQADARRATVDAKIREVNASLKDLAESTPGVTWDGGAIYGVDFALEDISTADYFHPSYSGQRKVADATWKTVVASGMLTGGAPVATPSPTPTVVPSPTATPKPSPTATATPKPTATPSPTATVAPVTVELLQPTSAVVGSTKLVVSVKSAVAVTSVTAKVEGSSSVAKLTKSSKDGNYYSSEISTKAFPPASYKVVFTVKLADGSTTTSTKNIVVSK